MLNFSSFRLFEITILFREWYFNFIKNSIDFIKSSMNIQFWIEHSSVSEVATKVKRIQVELNHLSWLEWSKEILIHTESELKKRLQDTAYPETCYCNSSTNRTVPCNKRTEPCKKRAIITYARPALKRPKKGKVPCNKRGTPTRHTSGKPFQI